MYKSKEKTKYDVIPVMNKMDVKKNIGKNIEDINHFLNLYVDRGFTLSLDKIMENYGVDVYCDKNIISRSILKQKTSLTDADDLGNVDLLITNVPFGKVTDATEQIMENGKKKYGKSLEVNALYECIDLLKPGKIKGINKVEEGGVGIIIVPDSILENTNKSIRDYMISRCDILAIKMNFFSNYH
ncbi:hypothetical protein RZO55_08945 [Clostridium boliviensis]|uniref:Uncharacterized protein n=1 Tax=Clostridium boliviensis TaxID=318465 RepID=A0ABU4GJA9_9CLOT|nr:hypothetical protein [Clostridium boliviensis]MDW2797695.1 hypothetical protein [Clostridium boliviensis]